MQSAMMELAVNAAVIIALVMIVLGLTMRIPGGSSLHQDSRDKTHHQHRADDTASSSPEPAMPSLRHVTY